VPHRWDGAHVRYLVTRAGELVPLSVVGDRRPVALANPGLHGPWATADAKEVDYLAGLAVGAVIG
jgi:gentisate 1,2-dioxygenase